VTEPALPIRKDFQGGGTNRSLLKGRVEVLNSYRAKPLQFSTRKGDLQGKRTEMVGMWEGKAAGFFWPVANLSVSGPELGSGKKK